MQSHDERQALFRELFMTHQRAVVAYVARRTDPPGDTDTAQDVASAVFITAWRRLDDVGPDPLPWLFVTARNVLADTRRGARRQRSRESRHGVDRSLNPPPVPDLADRVADGIAVREALANLNDQERELATLVAWDDLSLVQAAQVLGISPEAARTRWKRLRSKLSEALSDAEDATGEPARDASSTHTSHLPVEARP